MKLLITLLSGLFLFGCSSGDHLADLRDYVIEVDSKPKGKIAPPPEFKPYEFFTYSAVSMRAPFEIPLEVVVLIGAQPKSNVTPDFDRIKEILEEFRFESLSMVGTIEKDEDDQLWALVQDSTSDVHRVRSGNYLGKNHGKVFNISATQIDIMEIVPDGRGGWLERPRSMILVGLN